MRAMAVLIVAAGLIAGLAPAVAQPKKIIVLRHGEKTDGPDLCPTGQRRAEALAKQYLGKGARNSLFGSDSPAAFYAITGHTVETITPAAKSWGLSVLKPSTDKSAFPDKDSLENQQTRDAVRDVLTNPDFNGKIVVMVWEHKHIANKRLEAESHEPVTLRQLLHLDDYDKHHKNNEGIPKTWSGTNYDYFWVVDYANPASPEPTNVTIVKQNFAAPYENVPSNNWDAPEPADQIVGCAS
jgi:broad specificity phosphatase PhoE